MRDLVVGVWKNPSLDRTSIFSEFRVRFRSTVIFYRFTFQRSGRLFYLRRWHTLIWHSYFLCWTFLHELIARYKNKLTVRFFYCCYNLSRHYIKIVFSVDRYTKLINYFVRALRIYQQYLSLVKIRTMLTTTNSKFLRIDSKNDENLTLFCYRNFKK